MNGVDELTLVSYSSKPKKKKKSCYDLKCSELNYY